jgi:hypothetical protein
MIKLVIYYHSKKNKVLFLEIYDKKNKDHYIAKTKRKYYFFGKHYFKWGKFSKEEYYGDMLWRLMKGKWNCYTSYTISEKQLKNILKMKNKFKKNNKFDVLRNLDVEEFLI